MLTFLIVAYFIVGCATAYSEYLINKLVFGRPLSMDKIPAYIFITAMGFFGFLALVSNIIIYRDIRNV